MKQEYVKIGDVADEYSVSISTVRKWLREDKIPRHTYIKAGRTYRFNLGALTEALRGGPPLQVDLTPSQIALVEKLDVPISTSVPTGIDALDAFDEDY
tara:strand:- start:7240 stop:7533 length:294 start_codon:yes stop_codon:yes gene_type:complete